LKKGLAEAGSEERQLVDHFIVWLISHPLQGVALLAAFAIVTGLLLIPRIEALTGNNHPRC
jgi:hypothetical protein